MDRSILKDLPLRTMLLLSAFAYCPATASKPRLQSAPAYTRPQTGPAELGHLEAFTDGVMANEMKPNHIPGAVVSVVKDGKPVFEKGYGYSDYEDATPVDAERTLFRVGSISKLFVWTAVMQLAEHGDSQLHFILSGIAFGFSGAALRYHPCATAKILYLGVLAAVLPCVMFVIGQGKAYWMEWSTVGVFMLYMLALGHQWQALKQRVHAFA